MSPFRQEAHISFNHENKTVLKNNNKDIDILCVGEVLVDFIGHQTGVLISDTRDYHRYLGGSPANVAMNSARLGLKSVMVATVGNDSFGEYIFERLAGVGVNTNYIKTISTKPTSVVFVSKTDSTPDFIPFRKADSHILEDQISADLLSKTNIYHTTCFALSKNPAQTTILNKAEEAFNQGCKLSIDVNYAEKLWHSQEEALKVIKAYCKFNPLVKISEDDMLRLFEQKLPHEDIFNFFHSEGVDTVCLTLGSKGVKLSQKGRDVIQLPAIQIEVVQDATGAGDAFWSGFLFAYIKERPIEKCLEVALQLAALKLQNVGRLPDNINILSELL
ncbi:fructokinase [Seonamhaeicola aphaedonensis]|uniref:Fructokinase n=2 Tax=Seonamhaeicola aphaedonensis TaxID=1461338 RepID=A0A3D9HGS9_9FLAO|nr:fructokinase [Seonamhaeicola aphaedonensis]